MQGHLAMWQHHVITTTTLNQELLHVWLSDSKATTVICKLSELHPSEQSANQGMLHHCLSIGLQSPLSSPPLKAGTALQRSLSSSNKWTQCQHLGSASVKHITLRIPVQSLPLTRINRFPEINNAWGWECWGAARKP